jgi:hypothetical protein
VLNLMEKEREIETSGTAASLRSKEVQLLVVVQQRVVILSQDIRCICGCRRKGK